MAWGLGDLEDSDQRGHDRVGTAQGEAQVGESREPEDRGPGMPRAREEGRGLEAERKGGR